MLFVYSLLLTVGVLLLLPRFLLDAARHGKYAAGLSERAGSLPDFDADGRPVIWLHCVSVGETQAARPLVASLLETFPDHALVVSTTTLTGQRVAREAFGARAALICYFPFDWAWCVRRALRRINPAIVLVMETELWPRFLSECLKRNVTVALVNGRISEKSFRRYRLIGPFIRRALSDLSLALMQSEADAERIRALGLAPERVAVTGNVKFDLEDEGVSPLTRQLRQRYGVGPERPLILAASTHDPEERVLLDAYRRLVEKAEATATTRAREASSTAYSTEAAEARRPRLLLAPRHPERFEEIAALIETTGLSFSRRTAPHAESDAACDVILLDSIGELRAAYPLAELVFVGGSLARVGGHNVLEPALSARCIVTGPYTFNFTAIVRLLLESDALIQLPPSDEAEAAGALAEVFRDLLTHEARRIAIGERARAVLRQHRGATSRTVERLTPLLRPRTHEGARLPAKENGVLTSGL
jgi:3-deoxy-D-manno-octulosonic-acid transferase